MKTVFPSSFVLLYSLTFDILFLLELLMNLFFNAKMTLMNWQAEDITFSNQQEMLFYPSPELSVTITAEIVYKHGQAQCPAMVCTFQSQDTEIPL